MNLLSPSERSTAWAHEGLHVPDGAWRADALSRGWQRKV